MMWTSYERIPSLLRNELQSVRLDFGFRFDSTGHRSGRFLLHGIQHESKGDDLIDNF